MIKNYIFDYNSGDAEACFTVDLDIFTPEMARGTLEFFLWDYDTDEDPIDEVMKKYAMEAIKIATFNECNVYGVTEEFNEKEGFYRIDSSSGIKLTSVSGYEFNDNLLEMIIN